MPKFPSVRHAPVSAKFKQIIAAAELCISARLNTPALILLYSAIDAASWLCAEDPDGPVQKYFVAWVEKYLLTADKFGCSALDLWAARCGIVHTFSASSRLSREGKVHEIIYVNRGGNRDTLEQLENIRNAKSPQEVGARREPAPEDDMHRNVVIEVDDLLNAFQKGVASMVSEAKSDASLSARIRERESKVLSTMSDDQGKALLDWGQKRLAIACAPERQLLDLPYRTDCSWCGATTGRVLIRAMNNGGGSIGHSEICGECADAIGGNGVIRDFRKHRTRKLA
jgi:hypothetical protein